MRIAWFSPAYSTYALFIVASPSLRKHAHAGAAEACQDVAIKFHHMSLVGETHAIARMRMHVHMHMHERA